MATETILVKTKDNYVEVFSIDYANTAERARMVHECENLCHRLNYTEIGGFSLSRGIIHDSNNSEFLNKEILGYHYHKNPQNFRNEMATKNYPSEVMKPDTIHFSDVISDDSIAEMIKNIGYQLEAKDCFYRVERRGDDYVINDFDNTRALTIHGKNKVVFMRNHFQFPPKEYAELQKMISAFNSAKQSNPALDIFDYARNNISKTRERNLFNVYANECLFSWHLDTTKEHEIHHVKNRVFHHGLSLKSAAKRMSVEDCYRISVEDERSAYMSQLVCSINKYLKGGNLDDFSMFDNDCATVKSDLQALSSDVERMAYATNWPLLTKKMMDRFNDLHRYNYDKNQFLQATIDMVNVQPLTAANDVDGAWFKKLRSLYYNFEIYDPASGRTEPKNLAQYISPELEVCVEKYSIKQMENGVENEYWVDINADIIEPAKKVLEGRLQAIENQISNQEIDPELVAPAKALMRDAVHQSTFVNQVGNFKISSLYDEENDDVSAANAQPKTEVIPSDHAGWSDNLQAYWCGVEGYREIAKNNIEYKFKVNDATIRYTSPSQLEVSSNANYDLYNKILHEPTNKSKSVEFLNTLTEEQALILYVACINNGRTPVGAVPRDLSKLDNIKGVPQNALSRFKQLTNKQTQNSPLSQTGQQSQRGQTNIQQTKFNQAALMRHSLLR